MFRAGLGRWVSVAKLGPDEPVTCVHWACTMGRSVELVAVGAGSHVTVFSLRDAADAPKVPPSCSTHGACFDRRRSMQHGINKCWLCMQLWMVQGCMQGAALR